jgi:hypothetical protein
VIVTGPEIAVRLFTSAIASARDAYVPLIAGVVFPGLVTVTCPHPFTTEKNKTMSNEQMREKFRTKKRLGVNSFIADFKDFNPFVDGLK